MDKDVAQVVELPNDHANDDAGDVFVLPMSFAQQRLWFLDQFEPDSPFYNIPTGIRFKGNLNRPVLERAINEVIDRHETLRTTFEKVDGEPCQIVRPFQPVTFPVIDISDLPSDQVESRIRNLAFHEASAPSQTASFDLVRNLRRLKVSTRNAQGRQSPGN